MKELKGIDKAIENLQEICNIAYVAYDPDDDQEYIEIPSEEEVKKINKLAYKTWGYLLALKIALEEPKKITEDGFNISLFDF